MLLLRPSNRNPLNPYIPLKEAKAARLRRLCERKPSGKLHVPQNIHEEYMAGGEKRNALMKAFEECGMKKDRAQLRWHVYTRDLAILWQ